MFRKCSKSYDRAVQRSKRVSNKCRIWYEWWCKLIDTTQRSTIVYKDYGNHQFNMGTDISLTSPTTLFNLLSDFNLNQTIIETLSSDVQKLIKLPQIGLAIVNATMTIQNIRIEGKQYCWKLSKFILYLDTYKYIAHQNAIWFAPAKLESKTFSLVNFDAKWTSILLKSTDPINFKAKNINMIDYINLESGFNFLTQCNYYGATTVGEIQIDGLYFTKESANIGIFKAGSLIDIRSPFNITIINSQFSLINYIAENFDVIVIQDSGDWSPDDAVIQNIVFANNTFISHFYLFIFFILIHLLKLYYYLQNHYNSHYISQSIKSPPSPLQQYNLLFL